MNTRYANQDDAVDALVSRLRQQLLEHSNLAGVDIEQAASSMVRAVPAREANELAEKAGPFYDSRTLMTWLGISRQALDKRVTAHKLLGCLTSDRVRVYPVWQFTDSGEPIPGLQEVLTILAGASRDPWTWAVWLSSPDEDLDGLSAAGWLAAGRSKDTVIEQARTDAERWAA